MKCVPLNKYWSHIAPFPVRIILLTKTTAAQNDFALSYHRVRGLYSLAVDFVATIGKSRCSTLLTTINKPNILNFHIITNTNLI